MMNKHIIGHPDLVAAIPVVPPPKRVAIADHANASRAKRKKTVRGMLYLTCV